MLATRSYAVSFFKRLRKGYFNALVILFSVGHFVVSFNKLSLRVTVRTNTIAKIKPRDTCTSLTRFADSSSSDSILTL